MQPVHTPWESRHFAELGRIVMALTTRLNKLPFGDLDGRRVLLITDRHPVELTERCAAITPAPIVIEHDVWIGASPGLGTVVFSGAYDDAMPDVLDEGPFFHGTKADLRVGDLLSAGFRSNYRPEVVMNHIYFTALVNGAGLAAELAAGEGTPRVYVVEPTGAWENDPNVTDKKFPGNPTRSYRSTDPIRVVREVTDWTRLSPQALQEWRDRLAAMRADGTDVIIN
ncbi:MAG: rifampin ADP-ribosyl transferase [Aeromicrobium sp.]|jgi:hypothetical protein|nr:rifampin ADP-ribosyl transferase [Aeromicrobium sp.]